jgi:predicted regulator of Ras-like GTPase activity (Roadblock/LC7/MglB family)
MPRHLLATPEAVREISRHLQDLVSRAGASGALLVDESGSLIAKQGVIPGHDPAELTTLLTCNFLVTHELASYLGDQDISVLFHEGDQKHFYLRRAGERGILAVVFEDAGSLGRIQVFTDKAAHSLHPLLGDLERDVLPPGTLPAEYPEAAYALVQDVLKSATPTVLR